MGRRLPRFSGVTMVPARSGFLSNQGYAGGRFDLFTDHGDGGDVCDFYKVRTTFDPTDCVARSLRSDFDSECLMADEHEQSLGFRLNGAADAAPSVEEKEEEGVRQDEDKDKVDKRWLQLGVGGTSTSAGGGGEEEEEYRMTTATTMIAGGQPLVDFFSTQRQQYQPPASVLYRGDPGGSAVTSLMYHQPMTDLSLRQLSQESTWPMSSFGLRNFPVPAAASRPPLLPYYSQQLLGGPRAGLFEAGSSSAAVGPSFGGHQRPPAGIWFALRAAQKQGREATLPQIRKSYLRIRDEGMTVRVLMKYLMSKLGLDNESEIEITCKGQQLAPLMTLKQVRDNIWWSIDAITLVPDSNSTEQVVMVLHYSRRCSGVLLES